LTPVALQGKLYIHCFLEDNFIFTLLRYSSAVEVLTFFNANCRLFHLDSLDFARNLGFDSSPETTRLLQILEWDRPQKRPTNQHLGRGHFCFRCRILSSHDTGHYYQRER